MSSGSLGSLVGFGVSEHEATFHTSILKKGGTVIVVSTDWKSEQEIAKDVFKRLAVQSETHKGQAAHL